MRHKLKAFTLLEVLVGMILSGIVLTATFNAYRIITRQYESYTANAGTVTDISFFTSQLQSDFSKAGTITLTAENKVRLQSEQQMLEYSFSEKYVLRNNTLQTDTFHVSVTETEAFLKAEKINDGESVIDELHLMLNLEGKSEEKIYRQETDSKSEIDKIASELNQHGN